MIKLLKFDGASYLKAELFKNNHSLYVFELFVKKVAIEKVFKMKLNTAYIFFCF